MNQKGIYLWLFQHVSSVTENVSSDDLNEKYYDPKIKNITEWLRKDESKLGSGIECVKVKHIPVEWMMYDPTHAGSYIKFRDDIANTTWVLNIQNNDNRCVAYCMYSAKHYIKKNATRQSVYTNINDLNVDGINLP